MVVRLTASASASLTLSRHSRTRFQKYVRSDRSILLSTAIDRGDRPTREVYIKYGFITRRTTHRSPPHHSSIKSLVRAAPANFLCKKQHPSDSGSQCAMSVENELSTTMDGFWGPLGSSWNDQPPTNTLFPNTTNGLGNVPHRSHDNFPFSGKPLSHLIRNMLTG